MTSSRLFVQQYYSTSGISGQYENHAKNISEKDAEILFEHFSGMGQGLDFETEKNS